jgi:hypothetical protein
MERLLIKRVCFSIVKCFYLGLIIFFGLDLQILHLKLLILGLVWYLKIKEYFYLEKVFEVVVFWLN